ncbi:hypothetical protein D3C81_1662730 [compost metagenome]
MPSLTGSISATQLRFSRHGNRSRRLTIARTFASSMSKAVGARNCRRSTDTSVRSSRTMSSVCSASWTSSGTSPSRASSSCPFAANSERQPFCWLQANPTVWGAAAGAMRAHLMVSMQRASSWRRTSRQLGSRGTCHSSTRLVRTTCSIWLSLSRGT